MPYETIPPIPSDDDHQVLVCAVARGSIAAKLFKAGDFNEDGFLLYARLERLCEQGLLRFQSWTGYPATGDGDVAAMFTPEPAAAALAA